MNEDDREKTRGRLWSSLLELDAEISKIKKAKEEKKKKDKASSSTLH